jgi:hypothetical protein
MSQNLHTLWRSSSEGYWDELMPRWIQRLYVRHTKMLGKKGFSELSASLHTSLGQTFYRFCSLLGTIIAPRKITPPSVERYPLVLSRLFLSNRVSYRR